MTTLLYAAPAMFDIRYNLVLTPLYSDDDGQAGPTYRLQHYTFLFQTFMMMNLFNMLNCRVLPNEKDPQFNFLKNITRNWWFLIVLFFEVNMQFILVGYANLGYVFTTTPLTLCMHLTALGFGLGSLVIEALAKKIPIEVVAKLPKIQEEEAEDSLRQKFESRLQKSINKINE